MRTRLPLADDRRNQCLQASGVHARLILLLVALLASSCAKHPRAVHSVSIGHTETGLASWYGDPYHGRHAANGEVYDMNLLTAAHRTFPFGTWVEVANLSNAKRVSVRITDRGPFVHGRIIDLSRAAAEQIDMIGPGTARVHLKVIRAPAVNSSFYAVQVASFNNRHDAERLRRAFEAKRYVARLMESGPHWRVLVGRESSMSEATLLAVSLRAEYPDALVVRMEQ